MTSKKIAAGMVAVTMLATPAVGMIAAGTAMADTTTAATITINGDVANHQFKAFKIANYGNVTIDAQGKAKLTVASTDSAKIAAAAKTAGITVAAGQDPIDAVTRNATGAQVQAFAKALSESGIAQTGSTVTGQGNSATLNVTEGWYLVTDSKGLPMLVGTQVTSGGKTATAMANGETLGQVEIKSTSLSVDKKVKVGSGNATDDGSASVGSIIGYEVSIPMPDPNNVKALKYQDTLTGGTLTDTPTATIDGKTVTISPVVASNKAAFTVDLTGLLANNKGKTLVISYHVRTSAKTVTNDAQLSGTDANGKPITPGDGGGKDTSTVKAYDFDLTKVDSVSTATKLQGAKFKIQNKTDGKWLAQTNGSWSDAADEAHATEFTTDAQGKTTFTGLGNGTYVVKETTAPADHYISNATFEATVKDGKVTFSGNNLVTALDSDSAQVKNNPTVSGLAKTGEGGILMGSTVAAIMAAIGVACAFAYKRQQANA